MIPVRRTLHGDKGKIAACMAGEPDHKPKIDDQDSKRKSDASETG